MAPYSAASKKPKPNSNKNSGTVAKVKSNKLVCPGLTHSQLKIECKKLGKLIGEELTNKKNNDLNILKRANKFLDSVLPKLTENQVKKIENALNAVAKGSIEEAKRLWRSVDEATDEMVSTATIVDIAAGMTEPQLKSEVVSMAYRLLSRARLPTKIVGRNLLGVPKSPFQHPTATNEGYFALSNTNHYPFDINRRNQVVQAGGMPAAGGAERIINMFQTAVSATLGEVAPASASNVKTLSNISDLMKDSSTSLRETQKAAYFKVKGNNQIATQSRSAAFNPYTGSGPPSPRRV